MGSVRVDFYLETGVYLCRFCHMLKVVHHPKEAKNAQNELQMVCEMEGS